MKNSFMRNKKLYIGGTIIGIIVLLILVGLFYTPFDPNAMDPSVKFMGFSEGHIFGTDQYGRDIFSRMIIGMRTTLLIAIITNSIGLIVGTVIGSLTGYFGGAFDEVIMRLNDVLLTFPSILVALVLIAVLGPGTYQITLAMGIVFIPSYARMIRSEFIKCKNMDYVSSAKVMGASSFRIIFVHILPNIKNTLISSLIIGFNNAVLCEAAMSFLGIGVQPPNASLGLMLSEAQSYIFMKPSYAITVGFVIAIMILGFALMSDGLTENK